MEVTAEPDGPADGRPAAPSLGFGSVEILPIENDIFRFYRLST